jgi:hypothetical protein
VERCSAAQQAHLVFDKSAIAYVMSFSDVGGLVVFYGGFFLRGFSFYTHSC